MTIEERLIKYWNSDGYQLAMWDTGSYDWRAQTRIAYKFWHKGKLIFAGKDFSGSPRHADDAPQTVAALLGFLSLKPGDTDADYFDNYTPEQIDWARSHGEDLSMIAMYIEEKENRIRK